MPELHRSRRAFIHDAAIIAALPWLGQLRRGERFVDDAMGCGARLQDSIAADLIEISIPQLQRLYDGRKYTVSRVTQWYLDRIARYNPVYRPLLHVDAARAMATAALLDAEARSGRRAPQRGPLWGIPIVIKANTSVKGWTTSAGWSGYLIPGHELIAPADASIVSRLKAAGAIILGHTNMPDFAAGDTTISSAFGRTGNAYDQRFSPGGSSGGTATAVAGNLAVFGTGTDTGNSIRMPAATSALVGVLPTRGLVSIAGIHPLNWLLDNTGPIARTVTDAAIALDVMAGEDPQDFRTAGSVALAQPGPYTNYLRGDALRGRRFGVPAFLMMAPTADAAADDSKFLRPETRNLFMRAVDELRRAGATVVFDDLLLTDKFLDAVKTVNTLPYRGQGLEVFLRDYGPAEYKSSMAYAQAVGTQLPASIRGLAGPGATAAIAQRRLEADSLANATFWEPRREALAAYDEAFESFHLDGLVYPPLQMPPNDETLPLREGGRSFGPHGNTGWANVIGVPAISVCAGFYLSGLPFGIEFSAKRWRDGDLLGWVFGFEQATRHRRAPQLETRRP